MIGYQKILLGIQVGLSSFTENHNFSFINKYGTDFMLRESNKSMDTIFFDSWSQGFRLNLSAKRLDEIEVHLEPFMKKHHIGYSKFHYTVKMPIVDYSVWFRSIENEAELQKATQIILSFLETQVLPFFKKYNDLSETLNLVKNKNIIELNQYMIFPAAFRGLIILKLFGDDYYEHMKEDAMKLFQESYDESPDSIGLKSLNALKDLIMYLDNLEPKYKLV